MQHQHIRSDRGGEYKSREFEEYCKNKAIQKKLTAGYTPQQNGVSKRRNRTIVEMARTMMNEKGLPKYFWAEAVHTAVHILNRCPTKALKDKTPDEALSGIKPSVSHFKIFGCICYVYVPAEKRTKFDEKSQKCVFLGYSDVTKRYRFLDVKTNKLVVSRYVIFDETTTWNWEDKKIEYIAIISSNQEEDEKDEDISQGGEIPDSR